MADPSPEDLLRAGRAAFVPSQPPPPASDTTTVRSADSGTASGTPTIAAGARRVEGTAPRREFGRYQLLEELGRGGMGVVWKAWDPQLQRHVAIKMIRSAEMADPAEVDRFLREARAAARLRHPSIVPVHEVGEVGGQHYFTCDLVEGESLESARKRGPLAPRKAIELVRTIAEALHYSHGQGIVHRDVKPANVLLDREGRPYLTDFGLAKDVGIESSGPTLSGQVLGTPAFMSPEQAGGRIHEIGPASDQWSLGVMLYLLLTDVLPFNGQSLPDLVRAIREEEPIPPTMWNRKLHADAQTIVLKTLEKDPSRRYASIADFAADLGRHLEGEPIAARPVGRLERWRRRLARHRRMVAAAAGALLGVAGVAYAIHAASGREQVVTEKADVERRLAKVQSISRVLDRWSALHGTLAEIQACAADDALPEDERRKRLERLRGPVAEFMRGTPPDAPSQATMLALAGWAICMAGQETEGIDAIRRSQGIDPEVPYGFLMEALVHIERYVEAQPLPRAVYSVTGLEIGARPREPPELAAERSAILPLLQRAREAPYWGREGAEALTLALAGIERMATGEYTEVRDAMTRALAAPELRMHQAILRLARAQACYFARDLEGARADVEALLASFPRNTILLLHRAEFLVADAVEGGAPAGPTLDEARKAYDAVLEIRPRDGAAYHGRAHVRLDQGDTQGALEDFREALKELPDEAAAHAGLGCAHLQLGQYKNAIACFDEAIRIDGHLASSYANRSLARRALGQLEGAIEDATRAIDVDPRCAAAYNNRATARVDAGDLRGALADLDEAIRIGPAPAVTWFNRARVKDDLGDLDGAIADYTRAVELDDRMAVAWFHRAAARLARRESQDALEDLARAVEIDPGYEDAWFIRGYVRMKEGQREGAIADFRKALEVAPPGWSERERIEELLKRLAR